MAKTNKPIDAAEQADAPEGPRTIKIGVESMMLVLQALLSPTGYAESGIHAATKSSATEVVLSIPARHGGGHYRERVTLPDFFIVEAERV